jgi:hypothetical protein
MLEKYFCQKCFHPPEFVPSYSRLLSRHFLFLFLPRVQLIFEESLQRELIVVVFVLRILVFFVVVLFLLLFDIVVLVNVLLFVVVVVKCILAQNSIILNCQIEVTFSPANELNSSCLKFFVVFCVFYIIIILICLVASKIVWMGDFCR